MRLRALRIRALSLGIVMMQALDWKKNGVLKTVDRMYIVPNHLPIDEQTDEHHHHNHVPEPDENIRLLVDHVQRQNAKSIVLLYRSRRTILVEVALGHSRENEHHRIDAFLLRFVDEIHDFHSVRQEFAVEEPIHQPHLHEDVDQTQCLATPIPDGVHLVALFRAININ